MKKDIRASIDIGSNSVLLLVADVSDGKFQELSKQSYITSLGKELDKNKLFHADSMHATFEALKAYGIECDKYNIPSDEIIVTATEASRVARGLVVAGSSFGAAGTFARATSAIVVSSLVWVS